MKHSTLRTVTAITVFVGLAGCDNHETGEPNPRIIQLEKELAGSVQEIAELRSKVEQSRAKEDALTAELVRVKVERDKLKQEIAALRKKKH